MANRPLVYTLTERKATIETMAKKIRNNYLAAIDEVCRRDC